MLAMFPLSLLLFSTLCASENDQYVPGLLKDELHLTVPEIVTKYNYSVEVHYVVTEDGYILTLHRILPSRKTINSSVLLMHGIVASSADWIITGPNQGLGYILSDNGYDVWMANVRGNFYSRNHTSLNTESKEFWDFSWHEIGLYDLPAFIDYILETTQHKQIFYIGHSQGTTVFYVMCSLRPEYNDKIKAQFSLAPTAFLGHIFSPILRLMAASNFLIEHITKWTNFNELLSNGGFISILGQKLCEKPSLLEICNNVLFAIGGFDLTHLNRSTIPLILAHVPAGSSVKQMLHFTQEVNSGHFRQYDYGLWNNIKRYGWPSPPDYDLSKISAPMYFFYSTNDWLSSTIDVSLLSKKLKSLKGRFLMANESFTHIDFMFAMNAPNVLYSKILSLMTRYKN